MLTLGDKIIAGSFKAGSSWEVGDVGISAFGIDEALNKRRYLNGQVISQAQFVQFTAMLKSRVSVYPSLATTEVNWQAEVTNSALGQCGKFVIDDVAGTIRLPKVVNINGLQDLTGLGTIKAESLPNIKGVYVDISSKPNVVPSGSGAIKATYNGYWGYTGTENRVYNGNLDFNASRSSSTYQDGAPVQQEAVQYPYFIQVATGVEETVDVTREIELNNPFSLLDYKWSEYELSNASWLLSNGAFHSGTVYKAVYELLLKIKNGTETKDGVSVKLSTEAYADTDFVLNTADTTFRLPIKVRLASGNAVVGNGMALGFTNGTVNSAISLSGTSPYLTLYEGNYGANVGSIYAGTLQYNYNSAGVTTDPTKSGIETSSQGLKLYFYVGETVQDANVIAASQVLTEVAKKTDSVQAAAASMPSDRYIDLTLGASGSTYTAPANGWFTFHKQGTSADQFVFLLNESGGNLGVQSVRGNGGFAITSIPVKKGDVVRADYTAEGTGLTFRFIYAEGEN